MSTTYLQRYQALTPDTTVASKKEVIDSISNAIPLTIDASQRTELVKAILNDLSAHDGGRITTEVTLSALVALKTLGRDQAASSIIAKPDNLQLLKRYAGSDDAEVSKEALRCIANALLLVESGRNAWLTIGGGELCLDTMQRESTPVYVFLTARILFLSTVHQSDFTIKSVESLSAVSTVAKKLDSLLVSMQAGEAMSKDALTDTLKFIFNLLLQYPRMTQLDDSGNSRERKPSPIMGDLWDDKFEPVVLSLLRLFHKLPQTSNAPLAPPLTHVIHALLNVPISKYADLWFPGTTKGPSPRVASAPFEKARQLFTNSASSVASPTTQSESQSSDTLRRAYDLFDATLAHYIASDPDDISVRTLCKQDDINLDDVGAPVALLIGRIIDEDDNARSRMKQWLLPPDLDRSSPLEKRPDLLGRCLRLMASVYFPRLKDSIGEMIFRLCNSDPNTMALQVGYGNCAGYLFQKGIMSAPSANSSNADTSIGPDINPITGVKHSESTDDILANMTEEEKEREAEKLFVLFNRMEKMGLAVNPLRKAQEEGRFEEMP